MKILSSKHVCAGIVFWGLGFAVFSNGLHNDFMMDDYGVIFSDRLLDEPQNFWKHFLPQYQHGMGESTDSKFAYFRPWAHAPAAVLHHFFKDNPFGYHAFNLVLFILAVFSLYALVYYLLGDWFLAFLTGVLFLVHPINGLLVNYITAYVFSLQVIFVFAGLICAVKSFDHGRRAVLILALVCHLNALLCHETAFAFPVYLTLCLWFFRPAGFPRIFRFTLFFWGLDLAYLIFRMFFASLKTFLFDNVPVMDLFTFDFPGLFVKLTAWYVQALVTLQKIVLIKVVVPPVSWGWSAAAGGLILLAMVGLAAASRRKHFVIFALLWLAAGFVPVIPAAFFQYQFGLMLEPHWLVVSSAGYQCLLAWLFVRVFKVFPKIFFFIMFGIFVFSCVFQSLSYNLLWGRESDYARFWLKESPSLQLILMMQANGFVNREQFASAKRVYLQAAQSLTDDPDLYFKLALMEVEEGSEESLKRAKDYLLRAFSMNPRSGEVVHQLGVVYEKSGESVIAEDLFKRALSYSPGLDEARESLARLYLKQERFTEALDFLKTQRELYPRKSGLRFASIKVAVKGSRWELLPDLVQDYLNLEKKAGLMLEIAILLSKNNQPGLALKCFKRVLELDPDYKNGYLDAGQFLAGLGRYDDAVGLWRQGRRRHPEEPMFRQMIDQVNGLGANISDE